MTEKWLPIEGFEHYQVSNLGKVKGTNGVLKAFPSNAGYFQVWLSKSKVTVKSVHVLVCTAFNGPKPSETTKCLHRDDNKANNCSDNLYWGTAEQNMADALTNGLIPTGEDHYQKVLTWDKVRTIRRLKAEGMSQSKIADLMGIQDPYISRIIRNQVWKEKT